jgi:2-C-methyl-D-erythritol 2,4-cyclodiphosphate synthase
MDIRIGQGFDSHAFKPGVPLKIGGLSIDHPEGLAGHSDGDVLLHAITDALLGAVSAGDIGSFFPPDDPRWKDADSAIFLNLAMEEIHNAGFRIVNVDTTLVLNAPRIGLNVDHVAQAHAVVLLERIEEPGELQTMSAVMESQRQLEDVVRDLVSQVHGVEVKAPFDTDDIT